MPSRIPCFWLEPTDQAEISFRRYADQIKSACSAQRVPWEGHPPSVWGYHTERVVIEQRVRGVNDASHHPTNEEKVDARWPSTCACGYAFEPSDHWQVNSFTLYESKQRPGRWTLHDAPAGAMWDAPWFKGHDGKHARPDGLYIIVRLPEGDWLVDGPSSNAQGAGWQRTGTPPFISATPSIGFGKPQRLHGWLRNGVLEIDMP